MRLDLITHVVYVSPRKLYELWDSRKPTEIDENR